MGECMAIEKQGIKREELIKQAEAVKKKENKLSGFDRVRQIYQELYDRKELEAGEIEMSDEVYLAYLDELRSYEPISEFELTFLLKTRGKLERENKVYVKETKKGIFEIKRPKLDARKVADVLPEHCYLSRVSDLHDDSIPLYVYDPGRGIYTNSVQTIDRYILAVQRDLIQSHRKEAREWLKSDTQRVPYVSPQRDASLTIVKNGILNIETKELSPFSPQTVFTSTVAVNWRNNAEHPNFPNGWTFDQFLDEQAAGDVRTIKFFWQLIQYTLIPHIPKLVFVLFYSEQAVTGKSMFLSLLTDLVGQANTTTATLKAIGENSRFFTSSLYDKALIVGNENDKTFIANNDLLKMLASGDYISVEIKNGGRFIALSTPMNIQAMNSLPRFADLDEGTQNRLRVVEFRKSYANEGGTRGNKEIKNKYMKDPQLLDWIAHKALSMPLEDIIVNPDTEKLRKALILDSSPVAEFVDEVFPNLVSSVLPIQFIFKWFRVWAHIGNRKADYTDKTFGRELSKFLPKEWKKIKSRKAFTGFDNRDFYAFENERRQMQGSYKWGEMEYIYDEENLKKSVWTIERELLKHTEERAKGLPIIEM